MGYYIETNSNKNKAEFLIDNHGAIKLAGVAEAKQAMDEGLGVVVVLDNGPFEAAGYAFEPRELAEFSRPDDPRPKTFLAMDKPTAERLSGFSS